MKHGLKEPVQNRENTPQNDGFYDKQPVAQS
jgi:hypothetical protein